MFLSKPALKGQSFLYSDEHLGFNISLNLAFGSHFERAGINFNLFYVNYGLQANSGVRLYYSFKNLGPKFIKPELVLSQGLVLPLGKEHLDFNPFLSSVSNQTNKSSSIAYSYNAYFNKNKTTQQTGIIAFEYQNITLVSENDILARPMLDRFRTGAFLIQYRYQAIFQAGINCTLWTGQMGNKTLIDAKQVPSSCYMDTTAGVFAKSSHGLLSAQFMYQVGYAQILQANVGVDAEQIRNAVQNKFIHDLQLIPGKKSKNCHIPMIDDKGEQYLYKENQKIRPAKLYWNVFSNANVFY